MQTSSNFIKFLVCENYNELNKSKVKREAKVLPLPLKREAQRLMKAVHCSTGLWTLESRLLHMNRAKMCEVLQVRL